MSSSPSTSQVNLRLGDISAMIAQDSSMVSTRSLRREAVTAKESAGIIGLQDALGAAQKENFSLKLELHYMKENQRRASKDHVDEVLRENADLQVKLALLQQEQDAAAQGREQALADREREAQNKEKHLRERERAIVEREQALAESTRNAASDKENKLHEAQQELSRMQQEHLQSQTALSQTQTALSRVQNQLAAAQNDAHRARQDAAGAGATLATLHNNVAQTRAEAAQWRAKHAEAQTKYAEVERELQRVTSQASMSTHGPYGEREALLREREALVREKEAAKDMVSSMRNEKRTLVASFAAEKQQMLEHSAKETHRLEVELETCNGELQRALDALAEAKQNAVFAERAEDKAKREVERMRQRLKHQEAQAGVHEELARKTETKEHVELQHKIAELEAKVHEQAVQVQRGVQLESDLEEARGRLRSTQQAVDDERKLCTRIQKARQMAESHLSRLEKQLQEAQRQRAECESMVRNAVGAMTGEEITTVGRDLAAAVDSAIRKAKTTNGGVSKDAPRGTESVEAAQDENEAPRARQDENEAPRARQERERMRMLLKQNDDKWHAKFNALRELRDRDRAVLSLSTARNGERRQRWADHVAFLERHVGDLEGILDGEV